MVCEKSVDSALKMFQLFFIILLCLPILTLTSQVEQSSKFLSSSEKLKQVQKLPSSSVKLLSSPLRWHANFSTENFNMQMDSIEKFLLKITDIDTLQNDYKFHIRSGNPQIAAISTDQVITANDIDPVTKSWSGIFNVTANFLGTTFIYVELEKGNNKSEKSDERLQLIVTRQERVIDHVFTGSIALFASLLYINFGAALDLEKMKGIFLRPIGPTIGLFGQFIMMPLISYALGYILFPDMVELHLGLFFTGVSPGGGASNIWTVILQGNINLSIAMTTISNLAAFGMMPFWIFTLGRTIFERGHLGVPYEKIAYFAIGLIIPLLIGIGIQKYFKRISQILVRLLKPISLILIVFIIIFAICTNLYLFKLFSWKIILAGLGLPWLGYTFSWSVAKLCHQSPPDIIAIAIETGIQNTGIAIFLLRFCLYQPAADLTTIIPVSVAIMTPIPLALLYLFQKICHKRQEYDTADGSKSDIS